MLTLLKDNARLSLNPTATKVRSSQFHPSRRDQGSSTYVRLLCCFLRPFSAYQPTKGWTFLILAVDGSHPGPLRIRVTATDANNPAASSSLSRVSLRQRGRQLSTQLISRRTAILIKRYPIAAVQYFKLGD